MTAYKVTTSIWSASARPSWSQLRAGLSWMRESPPASSEKPIPSLKQAGSIPRRTTRIRVHCELVRWRCREFYDMTHSSSAF